MANIRKQKHFDVQQVLDEIDADNSKISADSLSEDSDLDDVYVPDKIEELGHSDLDHGPDPENTWSNSDHEDDVPLSTFASTSNSRTKDRTQYRWMKKTMNHLSMNLPVNRSNPLIRLA